MIYFLFLLLFLFLVYGVSSFIHISNFQNFIFDFFIRQLITLSLFISSFAIIITKGKTVFIIFIIAFIYLILKKKVSFVVPKELNKSSWKCLILIAPIILVQFLLQFDVLSLIPFLPSADVIQYASYASSMVEFGSENKYEALIKLYPNLFSGIGPYHYYEIWFTSLIGFFTGKSYVFMLQFIVYPYLIWLFSLGIVAVFEEFSQKITLKQYVLSFSFLLVGPVYLTFYESMFNDGDLLATTVFTVPGFVKQTLSFSYFGQKHLPVYVFGILSFLFLIKKQYSNFILSGLMIAVCSFGTFPGIFGAFGMLFLTKKELRTKSNFFIFCLIGGLLLVVMSLFKLNINNEISQKTFYFKDFLKDLNMKGEIIRFSSKFIVPFVWFSILYIPFVLLFWMKRKSIFMVKELKWLFLVVSFLFVFGALFISIVQGLNSDQFLTNLLPLFNVVIIITLIYLYHILKDKRVLMMTIFSTVFINGFFIINYYSGNVKKQNELFDLSIINKVNIELAKNKSIPIIAFLLSENDLKEKPPTNWYGVKPGKMFGLTNYFNLVNINYPYTVYQKNTSSIAFGPDNQMRFYLNDKPVSVESIGKYQVDFLVKNKIKWIFCEKNALLSNELFSLVDKSYHDSISGENYYKLK
jgi:hypothetical protein